MSIYKNVKKKIKSRIKVINIHYRKGKGELISAQIMTIWQNKKIGTYAPQNKKFDKRT